MQEGRQKVQRPQDRFLFLNTQMLQAVGYLCGEHFSPISTENRYHFLLACTDGTLCVPIMHCVSWHRKQVFRASVVLLQKFLFFSYLDEETLWRMMSPAPQILRRFWSWVLDDFRVRLADLQSTYTHSSKLVKYGSDLCMVRRGACRLEALGFFCCVFKISQSQGLFTAFFKQTQMPYVKYLALWEHD